MGGAGGVGGPGGPGGPGGVGGPGGAGNRGGNGNRNSNRNGGNNNINSGNNNTVINNPVYGGGAYGAYGWNGGMMWAPAPYYWGGGFWGAMAIGVTSAAVFGAIVDEDDEGNDVTYNSYEIQQGSPGATFLETYQLVQVQCGGQNLVEVFGPEHSVICANPNSFVAAGQYNLDTASLSLIPHSTGTSAVPSTP
ncbi:MAG: hypothetical protein JO199_06235 [Candidatus Eremiobacteraeota bacterium]|nr:hypothetical protein [Candidatus Eremiobacteraeota bacterium]